MGYLSKKWKLKPQYNHTYKNDYNENKSTGQNAEQPELTHSWQKSNSPSEKSFGSTFKTEFLYTLLAWNYTPRHLLPPKKNLYMC